ncbi:MAG: phosphomannose isomerase type II C-terminal cupin domain [Candidatus Paceibacterota bacterium]
MKKLIVERPWGHFDQFTKNEDTTVKLHFVKPQSAWSMQYHNHRSEFWRIISGSAIITIGDKKIEANPGDEFFVEKGERHRLESGDKEVVLLEICYGEFDEEDIVRIEDKYGRVI